MKTKYRSLSTLLALIVAVAGFAHAQDKAIKAPADPGKPVVKKDAPDPNKPVVKKDAGKPGEKKVARDPGKNPGNPSVKKTGAGGAKTEFAGVLNHCDENKDGAVSLAEFQKSKGAKDPASVESWFRSRDADRDGQLTANDFAPKSGKKS